MLLENNPQRDIDWGGIKLKPFEIPQQEGKFDLDFDIVESNSSVFGIFKYNTDLFNSSTMEFMATNFQNLLARIVNNPLEKIDKLSLLNKSEKQKLSIRDISKLRQIKRKSVRTNK